MMVFNNSLWNKDIHLIINSLPELEELAGKSILVTGAGGLICSSIIDIFLRFNETHEKKITIIAAARNKDKVKNRFGLFFDKSYFVFLHYDANDANIVIDHAVDYIIHGAGNAYPLRIMAEPVETMTSNINGSLALLDYSRRNHVKRFLYISSSEIYGIKGDKLPYKENEFGYIDLQNPRNAYSVGKRAAETLCCSYAAEYGVETVIVRPGHIYGPTASKEDNRVSSVWAYQAASGDNIVMKSEGLQVRSYCYCLDCASAIIKVLLRGENCEAYNISNSNSTINIKEMAEIVSTAGNVRLIRDIPTDKEIQSFNPMMNSSLNSDKLEHLGWKGLFDAQTGFSHTVQILKESL